MRAARDRVAFGSSTNGVPPELKGWHTSLFKRLNGSRVQAVHREIISRPGDWRVGQNSQFGDAACFTSVGPSVNEVIPDLNFQNLTSRYHIKLARWITPIPP